MEQVKFFPVQIKIAVAGSVARIPQQTDKQLQPIQRMIDQRFLVSTKKMNLVTFRFFPYVHINLFWTRKAVNHVGLTCFVNINIKL